MTSCYQAWPFVLKVSPINFFLLDSAHYWGIPLGPGSPTSAPHTWQLLPSALDPLFQFWGSSAVPRRSSQKTHPCCYHLCRPLFTFSVPSPLEPHPSVGSREENPPVSPVSPPPFLNGGVSAQIPCYRFELWDLMEEWHVQEKVQNPEGLWASRLYWSSTTNTHAHPHLRH